jgi:uncharacterized protein YndB with AHSA1/START domain
MKPTDLTIRRLIRASREKVFSAWTQPAHLQQWWGPGHVTCPEAHVDLREGGDYRLANLEADGSVVWITGRFEKVRAPEELVYTWKVSILPGEPTLVTVLFLPHPDGTEIVLTHARFATEALRDMHLQGWGGCLDKLEMFFTA